MLPMKSSLTMARSTGKSPSVMGYMPTPQPLKTCRTQLVEVLEEWIVFRVYKHLSLPVIDDIELTVKEVA